MKHLAEEISDMMVDAQEARTGGDTARATMLEQKTKTTIQDSYLRGDFSDHNALHKEITRQIIQRHSPRLSGALDIGKILEKNQ